MHGLFLPRLGQTMEEAVLSAWLVPEGAPYTPGEALYEIETEKITTGVEATLPGRIVFRCVADNATIAVGTLLAVVADPGEEPSSADIDQFVRHHAGGAADITTETPPMSLSASTSASAPLSTAATGERARAMPRTRALARTEGVDIEHLSGSGRDGLVIPQDIHAVTTLSPAHRRMAATLSAGMVPQFTQMVDADVTGWPQVRDLLRATATVPITFTDIILEAVVRACAAVPDVNAAYAEDRLIRHRSVDIALAMDTPDGLLVPVLRSAQSSSLTGRAEVRHALTERARTSSLTLDDMGTGTITLSNLGAYGITTGVPLLVSPYAAIVFVGSMEPRVVARSGGIAVRTMCSLAISFDHRVVDGATAARFTASLRSTIEQLTTPPTE